MKKLYPIVSCILLIFTALLFYSCPYDLDELTDSTTPTTDPTTPTTPTTPTNPNPVVADFSTENNPEPFSS